MPQPFLVALRRPWHRFRRPIRREHTLTAIWLGTLGAVEVLGRRSTSDFGDVVGVTTLIILAVVTHYAHFMRPIPLIGRLSQRVRAALEGLERYLYRAGEDLRLEPPLPRRFPGVLVAAGITAPLAAALLWTVRAVFPTGVRDTLLPLSPTVYFGGLGLLWAALAAGSLLAFAPPMFLRNWIDQRGLVRGVRRSLVGAAIVLGYLLFLLTTASLAARWIPLAIAGGAWALGAIVLLFPGGPRLTVLWRPVRGETDPAVLDHATLFVWGAAVLFCAITALSLLAGGDRFGAMGDPSTSLTAGVGAFFTWATALPYAGWILIEVGANVVGRFRDPARRLPTRVQVEAPEGPLRERVQRVLENAGFRVRFDGTATPTDVRIRVVDTAKDHELFLFDEWPLEVTLDELGTETIQHKLRRRDEVQRRRHLLRGLSKAFRRIPKEMKQKGVGTWVDPHLWFSPSLARELEGEEGRVPIGPPYRDVIPLRSRSHLHHVLRALEVDLVFVEQGVKFKELRRVYEVIFETYDVHGGEQRLEERHFRGLTELRVVLDLVEPETRSAAATGYSEPDYEGIGRARILHVFRERGGNIAEPLRPRETDDVPVPVLAF